MIKKLTILVLSLITLLVLSFSLEIKNMKADTKLVYYIITNPGEDASKTISITWQAESMGSYVEYTLSNDVDFKNKVKVMPNEELWSTEGIINTQPDNSFETHKRYVWKVTIDNLEEATKYIYRVVLNDYKSKVYHFTTAGLSNTWNFIAFTDFQCRYNNISHPLIKQMVEIGKNPSLAICSGDQVDVAGDENDWNWFFNTDEDAFTSFIYASSPGDHEYWGASINGSYPQYKEPYTYNKLFTYPKNGCAEALNSNYYFYYNNVLFISLDMCDSNTVSSTKMTKEAAWMKETVKKLEGTFQYLVVFDHKSIYGAYNEDSRVSTTIRPQWYPVFDYCNVDLVLSGHDHMYSRTYKLYNNKVTSSKTQGTYYLDMGSSGDKRRTTEEKIKTDGLHEKTYDLKQLDFSCGANIEVNPNEMIVNVYDNKGKLRDNFTIPAKRSTLNINCDGFNKDQFFENINLKATSKQDGILSVDDDNLKYVQNINVSNGDAIYLDKNVNINEESVYSLKNIDSNKATFEITLKDGTKHQKEVDIDLGNMSNFNTKIENKKFYITYENEIYNISDYKLNLYIDGIYNKTILDTELELKRINVLVDYLHGNHEFSIKLENDNNVLYYVNYTYDTYKPINIENDSLSLKPGDKLKLDFSYDYKELMTIQSSNYNVLDVDNEGNIRALGIGDANIEISIQGIDEPYIVSVNVSKEEKKNDILVPVIVGSTLTISLSSLAYIIFRRRRLALKK